MLQVHDALEAARDKMRGAVEPDDAKVYQQITDALYAVRSRPAPTAPVDASELKACPFCGEPGVAFIHAEMPNSHIAGCADADCIAHQVAYDFVSRETAIAAWNARSPPIGVEDTDR